MSQLHANTNAITLAEITVTFEGGLSGIVIRHHSNQPTPESSRRLSVLSSEVFLSKITEELEHSSLSALSSEAVQSLSGFANLTFSPSMNKVFAFSILPREAGQVRAAQACLSIREEQFDLNVVIPLHDQVTDRDWWVTGKTGVTRKKLDVEHVSSVEIQPKPPKMQISFPGLRKAYYTDETAKIFVEVTNEEEEDAEVRLEVQLQGNAGGVPMLQWGSTSSPENIHQIGSGPSPSASQPLEQFLGRLAPSVVRSESLIFQAVPDMAEYTIELKAKYHLLSDPQTSIVKTEIKELIFMRPFDGKFDFLPLTHSDPWPSYFHVDDADDGTSSTPVFTGLKQRWSIAVKLASFALDEVLVDTVALEVQEARYGAKCMLLEDEEVRQPSASLSPNDVVERRFTVDIQKADLEDRRPSVLRLSLKIFWSLKTDATRQINALIPVPQLTIPFGEPRVLASAQKSIDMAPLVHLCYTLENPSAHVLSLHLTMEASEDFAFSGPKVMTVQLIPVSRHSVRYNILPARNGVWIRPHLKVIDVGFGKTLKVSAADGCKADKKGVAIWVEAEKQTQ